VLVLPQELAPSISGLQETSFRLLCLNSPPMGRFQTEMDFTPALEPGWLFLPAAPQGKCEPVPLQPHRPPAPYIAQVHAWQGSCRVMLRAVCRVGLVVHRGEELAVGVFIDEAADGPLRVLAGQLLAAGPAFAFGLPTAAAPPQVLRRQPRARPAGVCQALKGEDRPPSWLSSGRPRGRRPSRSARAAAAGIVLRGCVGTVLRPAPRAAPRARRHPRTYKRCRKACLTHHLHPPRAFTLGFPDL